MRHPTPPRARRGFAFAAAAALAVPSAAVPAAHAAAPAAAATTAYEAEAATVHGGAVASDRAGYTGSGFVDYGTAAGGYVQFAVTAANTDVSTLAFRFADPAAASRPVDVSVNGTLAYRALPLAHTAGANTWQTTTITTLLKAGANTVRVTASAAGSAGLDLDSLTVAVGSANDWSVAMVESTMARFTPSTIGGWSYPIGLYLYGQYLVYQRTHDPAYLSYIKSWADRFVSSSGKINQSFGSLDSMEPGRLLVILYKETGDARYKTAATTIRDRLNTYPRTSDGGFWHATSSSRAHQLWGDGTFMLNPFLAEYGDEFGDSAYTDAETVKQLTVYAAHLQQPNGLLKHAYDESKKASWADPATGLSPEYWCRADGWYAMAVSTVLDDTPANQPGRAGLLGVLQNLAAAVEHYQDPKTGRWFQVIDKGSRSDDWTETSCSSMFAYALDHGVQKGYLDAHYATVAAKGYQGVLAKLTLGSDGLTSLAQISIGTNVGDYAYYIGRTQATNDPHGLGAFLIMNEQLRTG
jgi:unsaturated rhamnogalacturonyl hydrolase